MKKLNHNRSTRPWADRARIAVLTTVFVYFTSVYMQTGKLFFVPLMLMEMLFTALFIFSLFWIHGKISGVFHSSPLQDMSALLRNGLEGLSVVLSALLLNAALKLLPLFLLGLNFGWELEQDRVRVNFVLGAIIALFFYYFVERERNRKQLQEEILRSEIVQKEGLKAQLESLKNQVDPHFLFNSLSILGTLIRRSRDEALEYLDHLSEVYRAFLANSHKTLVSLEEELELVDAYLFLLKKRFGDTIVLTQSVPVTYLDRELPPGSLQMLVENAVKHNAFSKKDPLQIDIFAEADKLVLKNSRRPRREEIKSTGIGLQNIRSRYRLLVNQPVEVRETENYFEVQLPLLNFEAHESTDH